MIERGSRVAPTNSILTVTELANNAAGGPWAVGCKCEWAGTGISRETLVLDNCCRYRGAEGKRGYESVPHIVVR
jgi:hypothetical protein